MANRCIYEFDRFRLDPAEHLLLCDGTPVSLTRKAFQVLLVLVRKEGRLVDKSELLAAVWGDTFVEEANLSVTISMLRKALKDNRSENRFIETVARQGYRFLPDVRRISIQEAEAALPDSDDDTVLAEPAVVLPLRLPVEQSWKRFALPGVVAVALCLAGAVSLAFYNARPRGSKAQDLAFRSMAVMPFEVTGIDRTDTHIGVAIADDLISRFAGTDRIDVRPASFLAKYGSGGSPAIISREQKVDAVLSGVITMQNGQAHVAAKVYSSGGDSLWSGTYNEPISKISLLEDQIEQQVVKAVFPDRDHLVRTKGSSHDPGAFQLYQEGRYFWNKRTEKGFRRSIECFQQAVLKDPGYADAYAGLADSYTLLASYGVEPAQQAYPNAKASAEKALQLDDSLAEAHTSLGMVALYYEWDWNKADREFRRAIDLNPNYELAHTWDALYYSAMGQTPQALQQALRAQELDPLSLMANVELGRVYYWNRQYDKAVTTYRHALELDPYFARAHTRLGMALAAQKDYPNAVNEFREASKLSNPDPYLDGLTGYAEALGGNQKVARKVLADLTERSHHEYVPSFSVALLCIGLGDKSGAMDWLERAYEDRSAYMVYAKVDPLLDPLRADPRFIQLMKRMGLQESRVSIDTAALAVPRSSEGYLQ